MTEANKIKLLIVDDHSLFLEGLCFVLEGLECDIEIITAKNAKEAFDKVKLHNDIHIALLDLDLPDMHGFDVLKQLSNDAPFLPVVILSASENYSDMQNALDIGAMGYISKTEKSHVMLNAIRSVMEGDVYIPQKLLNPPGFSNRSIELFSETAATANPDNTSLQGSSINTVKVRYYEENRSIFIDNNYLIKGVAGTILWRLLQAYQEQGRTDFTNRELRLDAGLKLPEIADNLEARLLLLLRRLDDKCSCIKMEKTGRGQFKLLVFQTLDLMSIAPT